MSERLKPVTVRFTEPAYDAIQAIASEHGLSMADVVRRGFDQELVTYLDVIRYIDYEQGREIQRQLMALANIMQGISGDLRRIGVNFNQDVRLLHMSQRSGATTAQQAREIEHSRQRLLADMGRLIARYEAATAKVGDALCRILA